MWEWSNFGRSKRKWIFKKNCEFEGYDINQDAINLAKKNSSNVKFLKERFIILAKKKRDLIIAADVFEHVENSYNFLSSLKER